MSRFSARVDVMLKDGISDPQGQTLQRALPALGYTGIGDVRVGKHIILDVEAGSPEEARSKVEEMCDRLLANTVIESYTVEIG